MHDERLDCPIAGDCGGCALIEQGYGEQLRIKTDRVRDALQAHDELSSVDVESCLPAPRRQGYRNRAKLAVVAGRHGVRIGLHRKGTHRVVDLAPCRVQSRLLADGVERLRSWLAAQRLARPEGPLFYVDLRETASAGCHLTLVADARDPRTAALPLELLAAGWPGLEGIAINHGDPDSSYPLGPTTEIARGGPRFLAALPRASGAALSFEVPPAGFFQVAPAALEEVHRRMADHLGRDGRLYDLYCGVGVHGLVVARSGESVDGAVVVGVENSEALVQAARVNARRHGVAGHYVAGRVETELAGLIERYPPARVILNPGRSGCRPRALDELAGSAAGRIAYLSCNPLTLARDLAQLVRGALAIEHVVPVDLMPQTDQVEALALLSRG